MFAHRFDLETPLEETCRAFNWLIKKGLALYWATSAWPEDMIIEAIKICDKHGWIRPVADQCEYNCLVREHVEKNYERILKNYGYGTTVWSPLGGGMLTGKYNDLEIPEDSRYAKNPMFKNFAWGKYAGGERKEKTKKMLHGLKDLAEEIGATQAQLALAWILVNKDVSSCIIGASKLSQLESNLKALDIAANWTTEFEEKINTLLDNQPDTIMNFLTFSKEPSRRQARINYKLELGKVEYKEQTRTSFD